MNLLLDTSIFLWYIVGDKRLPGNIKNEIQNRNNDVFLSVVSIWECLIKIQIGNLTIPQPPAEYLISQRIKHQISPLSLQENTLAHLTRLPAIHKDPFDRILICQAIENNLIFLTTDKKIKMYDVETL